VTKQLPRVSPQGAHQWTGPECNADAVPPEWNIEEMVHEMTIAHRVERSPNPMLRSSIVESIRFQTQQMAANGPRGERRTESMKVLFIGGEARSIDKAQLAIRLRWPDVAVSVVYDLNKGLEFIEQEHPDVVFFQQAGLTTGVSSTNVIHEIRRFSDVPLIVLEREGASAEIDEIQALENGADDYVKANAGVVHLVARLVALMRRVGRQASGSDGQAITYGTLVLNPSTYEGFLGDKRLTLTSTEFRVLHLLAKNRGTVVTHRIIELAVWGDQVERSGVLKKYISRIRMKLAGGPEGGPWIANVPGVGYRLIAASTESQRAI
jgi:two-component system KDP operon response regulator KdpE